MSRALLSLDRFGDSDRCHPFQKFQIAPSQCLQAFSHQLWLGDASICYALYESSYTRTINIVIPNDKADKHTLCKPGND